MKSFLTLALVAGLVTTAHAAVEETSSTVSGADQTSAAKAVDVEPEVAAPKNWSVALESENVKGITPENQSYDGDVEAYQSIKVGYKLSDSLSVQVVPEWTQRYGLGYKKEDNTEVTAGNSSNNSSTRFEDVSLRLTKSNVATTGPLSWTVQGRYYAPTSDYSQAAGQAGQLRAYAIGGMELTKKLAFELIVSPRYYLQTSKNFRDNDNLAGKGEGADVNNTHWRILNTAGLKYSLTDALAVETTLGVYSKKKYNQSMAHFQDYSTSLYYSVNKNIDLNAGVRASDGALDTDVDGVELYNKDVSEYFGILTVKL